MTIAHSDLPVCVESDCESPTVARQLCCKHYKAWYRRRPGGPPCAVPGCDWPTYSAGYCATHRHHLRLHGDPEHADKRRARTHRTDRHGYVLLRDKRNVTGWTHEHRLVMEEVLGRPLTSEESVHHKNGDRADNRPANLELWSRYQVPGKRVSDLLDYAYEIIARYGDERHSVAEGSDGNVR